MTHFDKEKTPQSQYLNDSTLKQIIVADLLMLILFSIPQGMVISKGIQDTGLLIASLFTLYRVARSIGVINKAPDVRKNTDGLTSVVILILVVSGLLALVALDHGIVGLWQFG